MSFVFCVILKSWLYEYVLQLWHASYSSNALKVHIVETCTNLATHKVAPAMGKLLSL